AQRRPLGADHLALRAGHRLQYSLLVEAIDYDRLGAQHPELLRLLRRPRSRDDLMARGYELWHQPPPDRAGGPGNEHLHRSSVPSREREISRAGRVIGWMAPSVQRHVSVKVQATSGYRTSTIPEVSGPTVLVMAAGE